MRLSLTNVSNRVQEQWEIDVHPDHCPICHHAIEPIPVAAIGVFEVVDGAYIQAVYQCPRRKCSRLFIGIYHPRSAVHGHFQLANATFSLSLLAPRRVEAKVFADEVNDLSPRFVEIYNQAKAAEEFGLTDIAGPGYGKALEFLIKDFLIRENPDDSPAIKRESLGQVIKGRVNDENIRSTAERATWLRNDETHYERKWEDKDLADLKLLVTLTANWIHNTLLTRKITTEMSTGK